MGILKSKFAPLVALFVLLLSFTPVTVFAGYTSWDQVPEAAHPSRGAEQADLLKHKVLAGVLGDSE